MAAARARSQSSRDSRPPKPRSDVYVGLLVLSLLAQIAGALFLYLDYSQYSGDKNPITIAEGLKRRADTPPVPPQPVPPAGAQGGAPKGAP
jgi:hypothetical protein